MKIVTNSDVKKPFNCHDRTYESFYDGMLVGEAGLPSAAAKPTKETIRTYFPETWIWDLVSVG